MYFSFALNNKEPDMWNLVKISTINITIHDECNTVTAATTAYKKDDWMLAVSFLTPLLESAMNYYH